MRRIPQIVKCPVCGLEVSAVPGVETARSSCGRKIFIPPILSRYGGCTAKSEEVERLLDKVRRRGATLEEEALLEFFKQAGLLEC